MMMTGPSSRTARRMAREHVHRRGHVVDALEGERGVEPPVVREAVAVGVVETHAVGDARLERVRARQLDRRLVDVEAVHTQARDRRVASAIEDQPAPVPTSATRAPARLSTDWMLSTSGERVRQLAEPGPVHVGLSFARIGSELLPADPAAGAVRLEQAGRCRSDGGEHPGASARGRRGSARRSAPRPGLPAV